MITGRITKFNYWEANSNALIGIAVRFGGGKSQTSTSQVSIPPEILAQYQNVNSIANQVAQTPFTQYSTDPNAFVAPLTPTQQAGILGTNQYSTTAQPFYQQAANLNTPAGVQSYMNPQESQVLGLLNQQNQANMSAQTGNAIQNGAFGGDRAAVSAANLAGQQSLAYGNVAAGIYNNAVQNSQNAANLEGQLGSGAQAAGLAGAQAQLTAGQAQQQTEQAGETALYNQFLQQESYPFQTTQFLANIAEGTGALSGSTTTSNQPAPFFSDERLKEDIEPIGKTFDGLNIIKFRYKGQKQPHIGLSAQDVEKKHPEAVGLAGGYKTVDYDAATRHAADKGRVHQGGLVAHPARSTEGLLLPERRAFDVGGYAGLSPNSAWAAGFNLDPSYLQAQEAAYGNAPWGNAGPVTGSTPYGGKSHVPPSMGGGHAALSVARTPQGQSSSGLQGLSQGIGQIEGLGKAGKSLFNDAKGYIPGLSPNTAASVGAPPPAQTQTQMPPDKAPPSSASSSPVAPASNDASAGPVAGLDVGTPDLSGLDDLGDVFAARGGLIHRADGGAIAFPTPFPTGGWYAHHPETGEIIRGAKWQYGDMPPRFKTQEQAEKFGNKELARQAKRLPRDSGGSTPTFAQPTDDTSDDQSAGGDVPYDSGTGSGGLDIPDDKSNNHLAVAQPPSQSGGGGGGFNPLGLITGALGLFGLADGGRVGLAGGGNPDDVALPTLDDTDSISQGLAPPDQAAALKAKAYPPGYWHAGGSSSGPIISDPSQNAAAMSQWKADTEAKAAANTPPARDITVHKAPTAGLNPDVPTPNAQPVQMDGPTVAPGDFSSVPSDMVGPTTRTTVQPMAETPGAANAAQVGRGFFGSNQDWLVPLMHGLGTMASSNSRYLGSAILQGLGGAADSYENVQNEMMNRGTEGANIQHGLAATGATQANTGLTQAETGRIQAGTRGQVLQNEQTRQALANGDIYTDGNGNTIVRTPTGNMLWGDWAARGFPPTMHQVHTAAGTLAGSPQQPALAAPQPSKNHYSYLGGAGQGALTQDEAMLRGFGASPKGRALMDQSSKTEEAAQGAYENSVRNGNTLNQIASQISEMPDTGPMAGGPLNELRRAWIMHYNDVVNSAGQSELQVDPDQTATAIAANKLHAMMSFGMTHGMDQNSFGALMHANEANPSMAMPKNAAMKVLAGLYADKQQDIDRYNYLQEYKNEAASRPGALPTWYLAQNAMQAFNKDHDQTQYGKEKAAIEGILNAKNKNGPLLNQIYHGQLTPQQMQTLENGASGRAGWGPNIFRYFRND